MNNFILNDFYKNQQQRKTNHWFVPKMMTCLLFFLATNWSFAQGTQDFETQTALTTSYADGSFTENGITYAFVHSRDEGDYSITGKGIMLRRINENSHIEWTIPNGVGTLSFDARKAFTGGNNNRQLEVLVNGTSVWTSPTFGTSGDDTTIYPFSIILDEQGSTTIRIKIGGTATGNRQVTIDNISWTGYTSSLPPPCIVDIPDANFKSFLVGNTEINTNGDTEIQCDEATAFTGVINCFNQNISDLTGIEAFVNIKELFCYNNQLSSLDLSNNTALEWLWCNDNQLSSLNVSNNTALEWLWCSGNQLSSLDISNNTALTELDCWNNQLTSLDVSNNTALEYLFCEDNQLSSLDLSNNTDLIQLWCLNNQLSSLDLSNNTALVWLYCSNNQLTSLDLSNNTALEYLVCDNNQLGSLNVSNNTVLTELNCDSNQLSSLDLSNNTALIYLYCDNNQLTSLDLSNNTALVWLYCSNNQLSSLNLKNGNNSNIFFFGLNLTNNFDLRCIQVDDVAYSNANWSSYKDATACFSEDCVTPTFDLPTSVCQNATQTLPTTSSNTILGSWSPAIIDTSVVGTQTYIFIPTNCYNSYSIAISIVAIPNTPTGEENQTFTAGQTLADLVVNGDNLVWYSDNTYSNTLSLSEPLVNGATYYVRSENGDCQSEALVITVEEQASRTYFDVFGFKYYPNPVNDILHFSANQPIEKVVVSTMLGQEIKVNLSSDKTSVNLSNLPSGNYLVKVTIEGVANTIKVVKN